MKEQGLGTTKAMVVAGVMSGTSADGVDVAICRVSLGRDGVAPVKVLGHKHFAYGKKLRAAVLAAASGEKMSAAKLAKLSWKLGEEYATCVEKTAKEFKLKPQLVACHGQTILHDADEGVTWQIGEASVIAKRLELPVVSDFRTADVAAGGQGAPLVPMLDWYVFRHATKNRLLLNLGGIANVTALPADCGVDSVMAFDTGPANMVIDAVTQRLFGKEYDSSGRIAARGTVLTDVVKKMVGAKYFSALPPKSCGREEFGEGFVDGFVAACEKAKASKDDIVATATALTVRSLSEAYSKFCWPHLGQRAPGAKATEMFVAGGGAKNKTLMKWLTEEFAKLGVKVATTESAGLAVDAKEAAAFALLGWLTWHGLPGNVPSATGAKRAVVLGKVSMAGEISCIPPRRDEAARGWGTRALLAVTMLGISACGPAKDDSHTLKFLIESSPNNLDLRQGTDSQSERVGGLIYDALVRKDDHFNLQPWLATSWERPDALTWVFHLRSGVRFHDGKALTADDVAWSIQSMTNGAIISGKGDAFKGVTSVEVRDPLTLVLTTSKPSESLLFNLSDGLFGVVERGAGRDEGLHPVGTGPFRFVSQMQDKEVVLEHNDSYWGGVPKIERVRFEIAPDNLTAALELKKGSADMESNFITLDMVHALGKVSGLVTQTGAGARVDYANFNVNDPALRDKRVRQAIACAIDKDALIAALWRGHATQAETLLPAGHWAAASATELAQYPHDVARAKQLLDEAGLKPDKDGVRLRFTLKTSTDETTRLEAQAIQAQLREAGIALTLRSAEFGTFYSDITKGAFQMYMLRWIGSNEDPDIFRYVGDGKLSAEGANRGRYSNAGVDALLKQASTEIDQATRRREYVQVQQVLADELPGIPLWYPDNVVVHTKRLTGVVLNAGGNFDFLRTAELR